MDQAFRAFHPLGRTDPVKDMVQFFGRMGRDLDQHVKAARCGAGGADLGQGVQAGQQRGRCLRLVGQQDGCPQQSPVALADPNRIAKDRAGAFQPLDP